MKILLVDNGTKHLKKLKELVVKYDVTVRPLFRSYSDSEIYDLIILSGGSQFSVMDAPEIFSEEIKLINTAKKPIIGICEGCELIGHAYGAKLKFRQRKSKGIKKIEILAPNILKLPEVMEVYEAHHFAITRLGKELVPLAKSNTGFEIIKHILKPVFGLQFHPEMFVDKSLGNEVFQKILETSVRV